MLVEPFKWDAQSGWLATETIPGTDLIFYFGSAECMEAAPAALARRYPEALLFGCSTATGILNDELDEGGLVGVACRFHDTSLRLVTADVGDASCSADAGRCLGEALRGEGLAGALVLADGVNVNGSALTGAMVEVLGKSVPLGGGLAADGARFVRTLVGAGTTVRSGQAAALGFYGNAMRMRHASAGGWDPFGPRRRVTRSSGCVLLELDGKPALTLYERYLAEEAAGLPGSALLFPLLVWDPAVPARSVVRTVLSIDRGNGSMTFAGDIPEGWGAQLMRGNIDRLVDGAAQAGRCALNGFDGPDQPSLALLVSCVGRRLSLGQRTAEELRAVDLALGHDLTKIGFYSHGEIAPDAATGVAMLHNQTMAVTLLSEME